MSQEATLLDLSEATVTWLRRSSFVLAIVVVVVASVARRFGLLDYRPGGAAFTVAIRPAMLAVFVIGMLIAIRWELAGALVAFFSAGVLIAFGLAQLESTQAIGVVVAWTLPGVMWALAAADEQTGRRVLLGALASVAVFIAGGLAGAGVYRVIWGPTHPESTAAPLVEGPVRWVWSGAVTATGGEVKVKAEDASADVGLRIGVNLAGDEDGLDDGPELPSVLDPTEVGHGISTFVIEGLEPGDVVDYTPEVNGTLVPDRSGAFETFPESTSSFMVTVGGCARVGSNGAVFDAIAAHDPLLHLIVGDFHYGDIPDDDFERYADVVDHTLTRPAQAALYASTPIAYMWDDHDYGANDSDAGSPSRLAAMDAYRALVPSYELAGPTDPVFQAFTIGRVRFILTDARSGRVLGGDMWGDAQRRWFETEIVEAANSHAAVVWVNPVPWVAEPSEGADHWGGFAQQRAEIADLIATNDIENLVMVSGDAHMLAIDDGTNTDYSNEGGAGFPLMHVAALDRRGSAKGGPYSHGAFPGSGQYATIEVDDRGERISLDLVGRRWDGETVVSLGVEFSVDRGADVG